ncbi:MAG: hypothetical protein K2N35_17400, partial [Muribaculaceae bacterium]|nr:hypothetical protein [Muribaculaceae bacterium]
LLLSAANLTQDYLAFIISLIFASYLYVAKIIKISRISKSDNGYLDRCMSASGARRYANQASTRSS